MKLPTRMNDVREKTEAAKAASEATKKLADKPHWDVSENKEIEEDILVGVSLRMSKRDKEKLEKRASINKRKGAYPASLTDYLRMAAREFIENNPEDFEGL